MGYDDANSKRTGGVMKTPAHKTKLANLSKFWEEHIEKWKLSKLSQREYCRRNGLRPNRFTYWKCKFQNQSQSRIIQLPMPLPGSSPGLTLNIGPDLQIKIPDGFSQATLERVLTTLKIVS